jgi:hypothetical protein
MRNRAHPAVLLLDMPRTASGLTVHRPIMRWTGAHTVDFFCDDVGMVLHASAMQVGQLVSMNQRTLLQRITKAQMRLAPIGKCGLML